MGETTSSAVALRGWENDGWTIMPTTMSPPRPRLAPWMATPKSDGPRQRCDEWMVNDSRRSQVGVADR